MKFEIYLDECYFHMWAVRPVDNYYDFNSPQLVHFSNKESAEQFKELAEKGFWANEVYTYTKPEYRVIKSPPKKGQFTIKQIKDAVKEVKMQKVQKRKKVQKPRLKVYLVVRYPVAGVKEDPRLIDVYADEQGADLATGRLIDKDTKSKYTFHILKKTVKGNLFKEETV